MIRSARPCSTTIFSVADDAMADSTRAASTSSLRSPESWSAYNVSEPRPASETLRRATMFAGTAPIGRSTSAKLRICQPCVRHANRSFN
jgi:hypothetical protein